MPILALFLTEFTGVPYFTAIEMKKELRSSDIYNYGHTLEIWNARQW
jgi:hypothetical protein